MTLAGQVKSATFGSIGFDTAVPLSAERAAGFVNTGYKFCVRYVSRTPASRTANQQRGLADLSEDEANLILDAGLALMVVQHVAGTGWVPSFDLGQQYGGNAAQFTQTAGMPPGVNVWLDLEDIPKGTPHDAIVDYCNAWFAEVQAVGYVPGVYIGFNVWLSPDELFFDLHTKHYWRAAGNIPDIAHRGYQMFQSIVPNGKSSLDKNLVKTDALGGAVLWLTRQENS